MAQVLPYPVPHPPNMRSYPGAHPPVQPNRTAVPFGASVNAPNGLPFPVPQSPAFKPWESDPGYVGARNTQQARDAAAAAFLNEQTNGARYAFEGAGNPYATTALLKQDHTDAIRSLFNNLAARGILSSGETGYQSGQESKRYGQAMYDARRALDQLLAGYRSQYVGATNADQDLVNNALGQFWQGYDPAKNPAPPVQDQSIWYTK